MPQILEGKLDGAGLKFGIVVSRFNEVVTQGLLQGALETLTQHGVEDSRIDVARVPGAFEIPMAAKRLCSKKQYDAVLCLGAVIRGGTPHFEYVAGEASRGVGRLAFEADIPVLFGVLTTNTLEQALERAGARSSGNKGVEVALAAIEMANLYKKI